MGHFERKRSKCIGFRNSFSKRILNFLWHSRQRRCPENAVSVWLFTSRPKLNAHEKSECNKLLAHWLWRRLRFFFSNLNIFENGCIKNNGPLKTASKVLQKIKKMKIKKIFMKRHR